MIPINIVHSTAMSLMEKAAIDIPDDYLEGIKAAAAVEDGDLSSFVIGFAVLVFAGSAGWFPSGLKTSLL